MANRTNGTQVWADEEDEDEGSGGSLRALFGCVLFLLIISTLLGNMLVCAAVVKFRHLRSKVTNFFVISLAVSDLFVAVLVMPWKAASEVAGYWLFGAFCDTWIAFDIMCSTASILNLCIISLDRYWAISSPFRYERKMTQRVAFVMIGVAWTLSILISFIPVQLNWHKAEEGEEVEVEKFEVDTEVAVTALPNANVNRTEDCSASLSQTYAISSSLISFYIPVAIMIGTYTRIYRIAQKQIRRISSLERAVEQHPSSDCPNASSLKTFRKETKVLKTLSIIMGVFVFCWLPFFVLNCLVPFCEAPACVSDATFNTFVWFGWANSSLNPVIYAFNADFRRAFSTILGCGRLCAGTAVEAVNLSNEMVSYHHDTTLQKDAPPPPPPPFSTQLPNALSPSNSSGTSHRHRNLLLPAVVQLECEAEISLDTITPLTSSGVQEDEELDDQEQDI